MKISIIIVEYFSLDDIKECINHILQYPNYEIETIVSSNSQYSTLQQQAILEEYSSCKWCFNEKNGGFAYAMNRGLSIATGDYLVIINPDCKIRQGLDKMIDFMRIHPEIGAIAPQIKDENGNIQDSCRPYVSMPSFIYRQIKRIITKKESILNNGFEYNQIQTVDWIIGAFIMVSRKAYELTDGLSEDYFMYAEDLDWCTRIRKEGLEIVYYPHATIQYKGTRSARKSKKYAKIFLKSHFTYWKKFGFVWGYPKRERKTYIYS